MSDRDFRSSADDGQAESSSLIETSQVPDLERLAMQETLNVMTRSGELAGPTLREDGRDSEVYRDRLRELEARSVILGSEIDPTRPIHPHGYAGARSEDLYRLELARRELEFVPDSTYLEFRPRLASANKVSALEAAFHLKWVLGGDAVLALIELVALPPQPGTALRPDGCFDYALLTLLLVRQRKAEETLAPVPESDRDHRELVKAVNAHRLAIVAAMSVPVVLAEQVLATSPLVAPVDPAPTTYGMPKLPPSRPAPSPRETPVLPPDPGEVAFLEWCHQVGPLDFATRAGMMGSLVAEGADPDDRKVGFLASSLALQRPDALTPDLAEKLDQRGLYELENLVDGIDLASLAPRIRMAMIKQLATRGGAHAEARGAFAGALAAGLVREHPRALGELLEHTAGENKGAVIHAMARHLRDDEIAAFPRELVHAIYRAIGSLTTDEARRQSARLVRLANRK